MGAKRTVVIDDALFMESGEREELDVASCPLFRILFQEANIVIPFPIQAYLLDYPQTY